MNHFLANRSPELRRRLLLVLVAGVPLFFLRAANDAIELPKVSLLLVLVPIVAGLRVAELLQDRALPPAARNALVPAGIVGAALLIAWLLSPYRGWALFGHYARFLGLVPYLLTCSLCVLIADAFHEDAAPVARAWVSSAAIVGVYGIAQVAGLDPLDWQLEYAENTVASSTIGNPNFTGGYLGMTLPVLLGLWRRDSPRRPFIAAAALPIIACWIVAGSAGGWAAGVAGACLTAGFLLGARWRPARSAGLAVAGGILLVAGAVVVLGLTSVQLELVDEQRSRAWLWQAAVGVASEAPVWGRGPNAYAIENVQHRQPEHAVAYNLEYSDDPHNIPLAFASSAGLLGVAAFFVAMAWSLRQGFRSSADDAVRAGFFGVVAAYAVQSLVSIDTTTIRSSLWIAVGALAIAATGDSRTGRAKKRSRPRKGAPIKRLPAVLVAAAIALSLSWWGITRFMGTDMRFHHAMNLIGEGKVTEAQEAFGVVLHARDDLYYRRAYANQMGNVSVALANEGENELAGEYLDLARSLFRYSSEIPHVHSIIDEARLLRDTASLTEDANLAAARLFERAAALDRFDPLLLAEASRALIDTGRHEDALLLLERELDVIAGLDGEVATVHPEYWDALADARRHAGDVDGAEEAKRRAAAARAILYPGT